MNNKDLHLLTNKELIALQKMLVRFSLYVPEATKIILTKIDLVLEARKNAKVLSPSERLMLKGLKNDFQWSLNLVSACLMKDYFLANVILDSFEEEKRELIPTALKEAILIRKTNL